MTPVMQRCSFSTATQPKDCLSIGTPISFQLLHVEEWPSIFGKTHLTSFSKSLFLLFGPEKNTIYAHQLVNYGSGTFRAKTSSSRDGSRKNYFSNGTFPPGTVRAFFKK